MKTQKEIEKVLAEYLREEVFDPTITLVTTTNLLAAGFDSLALLKLLHFVEETLDVRIPESEITEERISTIENLSELIHKLQKDETTIA